MSHLKYIVVLLFVSLMVGGCSQISFYSQSFIGHTKLVSKSKSVKKVLAQTEDENLKRQLELSQEVLAFAVDELGLPDTKSYRKYVELDKDFPVWNVVAAGEFSLKAEQWCYIIIGCATYRGYFAPENAERYAQKIQEEGLETHVRGAVAYSTLGFFRDPLLSSMFRYGDLYLIEILIHELAHQELYLDNWTDLNESFANVVAREGVRRWLAERSPEQQLEYDARKQAGEDFAELVKHLKLDLAVVYEDDQTVEKKREAKKAAIDVFRVNYEHLKQGKWSGRGWYDNWMSQPLNNARLAGYSTYQNYVPSLERLLVACDNDLPRFYAVIAKLDVGKSASSAERRLPENCGEPP